jgi:hypothetical protein
MPQIPSESTASGKQEVQEFLLPGLIFWRNGSIMRDNKIITANARKIEVYE